MTPYVRDEAGAPVLAESFVLFLDVLGASDMANDSDVEHRLRALDRAVAKGREVVVDNVDRPWFISSWFSDNLTLASPIRPGLGQGEPELGTFLNVAETVQLHLALDGFFTRGGLALGLQFMDENISFGAALVDAVALEQQATHPRIILGQSVVERVEVHIQHYMPYPEHAPHDRVLWVDQHGEVFVNYLDAIGNYVGEEMREAAELVEQHRDQVTANLDRHRENARVWDKYSWTASYHNAFCATHALNDLTIDPVHTNRTYQGVGKWRKP